MTPHTMEAVLQDIKAQASASKTWDLDFSIFTEQPATALMGSVVRALATVASSATAATAVERLRISLHSTACAQVAMELLSKTPLFSSIQSVELIIDAAEWTALAHDGGDEANESGVAALLLQLAQFSAAFHKWTAFSLVYHDASLNMASYTPAHLHRLPEQMLWDDRATEALTAVVRSKPWTALRFPFLPLSRTSGDTRLRLWEAISATSSLQTLDLRGISTVAALFQQTSGGCEWAALRSLDISYTRIGEVAFAELLNGLQKSHRDGWCRLQHLGLSQCCLGDYATHHLAKQLHPGDAASRGSSSGPLLEVLQWNGNAVSRDAAFAMAGWLGQCWRLQEVDLRHCGLRTTGAAEVLSALSHATSLRVLRLRSNRVGDEAASAIASSSRHWPALKELDMTRCRLTTGGLRSIAAALQHLESLEVLRLSGNDLRPLPKNRRDGVGSEDSGSSGLFAYDPAFMRQYGAAAKTPTSFELDRRDREEGRVRYTGNEECKTEEAVPAPSPMQAFGGSLATCRRLRVLDLGDAALSDDSLVEFVQHCPLPALREVYLGANAIFTTVAALDALVQWLWCSPQLAVLDLSCTALGDLGVSMLCDGTLPAADLHGGGVLRTLRHLHTLQLSHAKVEGLGMESLAAAVSQISSLQRLSLDGNTIRDTKLILELLSSLLKVPRLQSVSLVGCCSDPSERALVLRCSAFQQLRSRGVEVLI